MAFFRFFFDTCSQHICRFPFHIHDCIQISHCALFIFGVHSCVMWCYLHAFIGYKVATLLKIQLNYHTANTLPKHAIRNFTNAMP